MFKLQIGSCSIFKLCLLGINILHEHHDHVSSSCDISNSLRQHNEMDWFEFGAFFAYTRAIIAFGVAALRHHHPVVASAKKETRDICIYTA